MTYNWENEFNNKESYLLWVSTWKAEYKQLASIIKENKKRRARPDIQSKLYYLAKKATIMLERRSEAKIISWQMKLKRVAA